MHGFDEFYGNLYHLNAEEEPEQPDYPKDLPIFQQFFMPRGVLECKATDVDDPTEDPRFGRVGKQTIDRHRPADPRADGDGRGRPAGAVPRLHRPRPPGRAAVPALAQHDPHARLDPPLGAVEGQDRPGLVRRRHGRAGLGRRRASRTSSTSSASPTTPSSCSRSDNGAEKFTWPDGGTSPFRGEKGLGWEGGFRAPFAVRWPGTIPGGQVLNGIFSLEDVVPTVMAAAGVTDVKEQLLEGYQAGEKNFRVHLDGYNQLPYLTGEVERVSASRVLLLRRARPVRAALQQLEGALPDQGRLVRRWRCCARRSPDR